MIRLTRKLYIVLLTFTFCLGLQTAARAELQAGVEYRFSEDRQSLNTLKADWWLLPQVGVRGSVDVEEFSLAMDLLYRKHPQGRVSSYMGLGVRDLFNSTGEAIPVQERLEIIVGMELRITSKIAVAAETRFVPINRSHLPEMKPIVGIALKWVPKLQPNWPKRVAGDRDLYLLAKLITAEAGQEPYAGQVAVGAVVLNRMKSNVFPGTIQEVIYQDGQFSSLPKLPGVEPSAAALRAAREALAGADPSRSALYFYNPVLCEPESLQFFNSPRLQVTVKIGNHVFLKEVE
jgi:hypothetical protein